MDAIWQGLSGIFELVLMAGLGFFLAKKGWFWESAAKDLTKLTMTVALPPLMIHSLYANFTHDALLAAAPDLVLPFASIFVAYLACFTFPKAAAAFLSVPAASRMPSSSVCL